MPARSSRVDFPSILFKAAVWKSKDCEGVDMDVLPGQDGLDAMVYGI